MPDGVNSKRGSIGRGGWRLAAWAFVPILCFASADAFAAPKEDKPYTVGNYPIEARAVNAVTAKEKALAEGQQAAFRSLLKRIVPVSAYNRISKVKPARVGDLLEGFSVRSERNSSTEYIASYDFAFQAEAVRRLLDKENIPFIDRQAPTITIVPVYRAPANTDSGDALSDARGSDTWMYAWKGLDLANTLTPATLTLSKQPLPAATLQGIAAGDPASVSALTAEMKMETVVVALLEPDPSQKRIRVTLVGRDAVAPFSLRRVYRMEGGDLSYTAELAAVVALGVLEGRWKAINVRAAASTVGASYDASANARETDLLQGPPPIGRPGDDLAASGPVRISVEFRGMDEWTQISRRLSQTPDISDLEVEGLSARGARVALRYPGGTQRLALALAQQGLILRNAGGTWVLTARATAQP